MTEFWEHLMEVPSINSTRAAGRIVMAMKDLNGGRAWLSKHWVHHGHFERLLRLRSVQSVVRVTLSAGRKRNVCLPGPILTSYEEANVNHHIYPLVLGTQRRCKCAEPPSSSSASGVSETSRLKAFRRRRDFKRKKRGLIHTTLAIKVDGCPCSVFIIVNLLLAYL